jgi:hypothetical protein
MPSVRRCGLPDDALLRKYLYAGAYADCYVTEVAKPVSHAEYVEAFYTTTVFKAERLLLKWFVSRPSSDMEAGRLASGSLDSFAAWRVESREPDQLLLADFTGRTRSWLMVAAVENGSASPSTRLYFGSAVVPVANARSGKTGLGFKFRALLGFHKLYSRMLLLASSKMIMNKRD